MTNICTHSALIEKKWEIHIKIKILDNLVDLVDFSGLTFFSNKKFFQVTFLYTFVKWIGLIKIMLSCIRKEKVNLFCLGADICSS